MANLQEILRIESENSDKIHFYREGVFYKAYEQSAYLFVTHVKPFMVKKQFVKSVNREVVSIGFPTNSIHSYFESGTIVEKENEAEVAIDNCMTTADFEKWRENIKMTLAKETSAKVESLSATSEYADTEKSIILKIKIFPIESKTPLDCMLFLSELKKSLK